MSGPSAPQANPFEEQRHIYDLLSQETRHLVLQYVLGHPKHLLSLDELDYMIPKSKAAIRDQLENLVAAEVLAPYTYEPNEDVRDLPAKFYGLTEYGVEILEEYNYLRGLPVARVLYANTRKSEQIARHEDAPRPELPEGVARALTLRENASKTDDRVERLGAYIRSVNGDAVSVEEQVELAREFLDADVSPSSEGLTRSQIEEKGTLDLDFSPGTLLENLVEIGVLEKYLPPGPSVYAVSERREEIVNGETADEAEECLEALIAHVEDEILYGSQESLDDPRAVADGAGRTIRSILSERFQIEPEAVEERLRTGDAIDTLNTAVDAIEESPDARRRDDYGRILFINPAYRYRLTDKAIDHVEG